MKRLVSILAGSTLALAFAAGSVAAAGNGPPHVGFIVDGDTYRTVGTKTDFSNTGAPAHHFEMIDATAPRPSL